MVDRAMLLSELIAALHVRIVRHYRLIRVLSDQKHEGLAIERLAARVAELEDVAVAVVEWMQDPGALERWRLGDAGRTDHDD